MSDWLQGSGFGPTWLISGSAFGGRMNFRVEEEERVDSDPFSPMLEQLSALVCLCVLLRPRKSTSETDSSGGAHWEELLQFLTMHAQTQWHAQQSSSPVERRQF